VEKVKVSFSFQIWKFTGPYGWMEKVQKVFPTVRTDLTLGGATIPWDYNIATKNKIMTTSQLLAFCCSLSQL